MTQYMKREMFGSLVKTYIKLLLLIPDSHRGESVWESDVRSYAYVMLCYAMLWCVIERA